MNIAKTVFGLRLRYIIGLSVIGLLVTASYITLQHIVSEQREFARLVNLAGHQAGLSNRIAYFASTMATTDDEAEFTMARGQIGRAINQMQTVHHTLRNGDEEKDIPRVTSETLELIYDDPMVGLDSALTNYLERAIAVSNSEPESFSINSGSYIFLTNYGPHVLEPLLNAAVDEYEQIGRKAILRIEKIETAIWIATLVTLLLELGLIFIPMERRVRKTLNSNETTIFELQTTRTRLLSAQKLALVGDWELDLRSAQLTWSDQVYDICGLDRERERSEVLSQDQALELIHPGDRDRVRESLRSLVLSGEPSHLEYRVIQPNGSERLVFQHSAARKDNQGQIQSIVGTIQDITERKELSKKLDRLSEHIPGFIFEFQTDAEGRISMPYASKGILDTYGVSDEEVRRDSRKLYEMLHPEDVDSVSKSIERSGKRLRTWRSQFRVLHPEKGYVWLEGHATPARVSDGGILWHGYIWDITERKKSEVRIRKLALYDPLTGLANRRLLRDRMSNAIARSARNKEYGAVIMLDLDNFKTINDTKGHEVGDKLLQDVAENLQNCVRDIDTIARLGGDEFVVVLEQLGSKKEIARKQAIEIAEKIRRSLSRIYYLGEERHLYHGSVSVGLTLFFDTRRNESELLKRADVAMYEAKEQGRNQVCYFSEKRQQLINKRNTLAQEMQFALEQNEFTLHYQPQVTPGGELYGAEALLRWFPKDKDPVSPGSFIPIAESNGFIIKLGEWVLDCACKHLLELQKSYLPEDFTLSINISARQLNDLNFVDRVKAIIQANNVRTDNLVFELTESSFIQDPDKGIQILERLNDMGIRIDLDDFGTGYSSLNSLQNLPFNALKLDRSLIKNVESENSSRAILRATLAMAEAMSMKVVAEGVETQTQKEMLSNEGCDILQGYLIARPMPLDDLKNYLAAFASQKKEPSLYLLQG
ncbi:MAG: EAL domain-containing protein [Desulfobulbaceae bacterium]|nr:MAG: EAL domain-containing protein [Desulfobulbaceae bacterium]